MHVNRNVKLNANIGLLQLNSEAKSVKIHPAVCSTLCKDIFQHKRCICTFSMGRAYHNIILPWNLFWVIHMLSF